MRFACSMVSNGATVSFVTWLEATTAHVTKCTHSQVVGLRLEGNPVIPVSIVEDDSNNNSNNNNNNTQNNVYGAVIMSKFIQSLLLPKKPQSAQDRHKDNDFTWMASSCRLTDCKSPPTGRRHANSLSTDEVHETSSTRELITSSHRSDWARPPSRELSPITVVMNTWRKYIQILMPHSIHIICHFEDETFEPRSQQPK